MKKMTFDEYDKMVERVQNNPYQCVDWWPTPAELKEKLNGEYNQNIDFLTWIIETNNPPETEAEKESKKYINKLLYENLKLVDNKEKK